MFVMFATQYDCPCVCITGKETFDEVIYAIEASNAIYFDGEEFVNVVKFADRPPELYTNEALRRSLPERAEHQNETTQNTAE